MKKLFALPIIGLILGAVAIATEIKISDPVRSGQQLSGAILTCLKSAVDKKETALVTAATTYQNGYIAALNIRKTAVLAAWKLTTKKDIKLALNAASKAYKTSLSAFKKDLKASQKAYNTTFKTEVKACKGTGLGDLTESNNIDD